MVRHRDEVSDSGMNFIRPVPKDAGTGDRDARSGDSRIEPGGRPRRAVSRGGDREGRTRANHTQSGHSHIEESIVFFGNQRLASRQISYPTYIAARTMATRAILRALAAWGYHSRRTRRECLPPT